MTYQVKCAGKVVASYSTEDEAKTASSKIPGSSIHPTFGEADKPIVKKATPKKSRPTRDSGKAKKPAPKAIAKKTTKPVRRPKAKACAKEDPKVIERLSAGRKLVAALVKRMEGGENLGPVTIIRYLAYKTNLVRKEVLKIAEEFGINVGTASRQFQEARSGKATCPQI